MTIKELMKFSLPRTILVIGLYLIYGVSGALGEFLFKNALNGITQGNMRQFILWIGVSSALEILTVILLPLASTVFARQIQNYLHQIRKEIMHHYYQKHDGKVAEMQNQLTGNLKMLTDDYATPWITILSGLIEIISCIGLLISMNWWLLVFTVIFAVITLSLPKIMEKRTSRAEGKVNQMNSKLLAAVEHWLNGLQELRRYHSYSRLKKSLNKASENYVEASKENMKVQSWAMLINAFGNSIAQVGMSFFAGILFFNGMISFGAWAVAGGMAFTIFTGIWDITSSLTQVKSTKKLREETAKLRKTLTSQNQHHISAYGLKVTDLSVKYPNGEEIIYPDFEIKKGKKVLLTGDSGTGKSTLFKLLLGKISAQTGKIAFLDQDGREITQGQEKLAYIPQDSKIFPVTISENITMFNSDLAEKVQKASQAMQFSSDLVKIPQGLETKIDLKEDNLSGGQKQKVVLARNLVHEPTFTLMDEATSAIDSKATKKIIENLLQQKQTVLMIAHNFSPELREKFDYEIKLTSQREVQNA